MRDEVQAGKGAAVMEALLSLPGLPGLLARRAGPLLVFDAAGLRLLASSARGAALAEGIVDEEGGVLPDGVAARALRTLAEAPPAPGRPRLERLAFDPSRRAPPLICTCLTIDLPGHGMVLVVTPADSPRRPLGSAVDEPDAAVPVQAAAPAPGPTRAAEPMPPPVPPVRFTWRSDGEGRVVEASPELADRVRGGVIGRTWDALLAGPVRDRDGLLGQALAAGETFRAVPVLWRIAGTDRTLRVDLAATPRRSDAGRFAGFGGFGLIRDATVAGPAEADAAGTEAVVDDACAPPHADEQAAPAPVAGEVAPRARNVAPDPAPDLAPVALSATAPDPRETAEAKPSPPRPGADQTAPDQVVPDLTMSDLAVRDLAVRDQAVRDPAVPDLASLAGAAMAGFAELVTAPFTAFGPAVTAGAADPARDPQPSSPDDPGPAAADEPPVETAGLDAETPDGDTPPTGTTGGDTLPAGTPPGQPGPPTVADSPSEAPATAADEDVAPLSTTEHHNFREIARALGARFAGDDAEIADIAAKAAPSVAAVTPFRAVARFGDRGEALALLAPSEGEADVRRLLDRLPIGLLVHRGEAALYANRALLEAVDFADLTALQAEGGVARLFRGGEAGRPRPSTEGAAIGISTRSGATIPVEVRLTTVEWEGFPAGLMLVRRLPEIDPAQRAAALELDLAARDTRLGVLGAVLDAVGDGVAMLDAGLRITRLNGVAEALLGYDQREVAGESVDLLFTPESRPAVHTLINAARDGEPAIGEGMGRRRQGARMPLDLRVGRLPEGQEPGYCVILRDAAASRAVKAALAEAERKADQAGERKAIFVERIGHAVRTPLNAILGFAEVMLEERFGPVGSERYRAYLRDIHASGGRIIALVGDLLDLASVEAGRRAMTIEPVDLNAVASSCAAHFQPHAARTRIIMRTSFAGDLPRVLADAPSLRQIAANLVGNAIRYTPAGGQVIVSTATTDRGEVALRVRDTGVGMSPEEIAVALDPFRTRDTLPARPDGGAGLGLPLAKALAAANRATLQVTSRPGEGTLVELLLRPAADA